MMRMRLTVGDAPGEEGEGSDGRMSLWQRSRAPLLECYWQGRLIPGARVESLPFIEVCSSACICTIRRRRMWAQKRRCKTIGLRWICWWICAAAKAAWIVPCNSQTPACSVGVKLVGLREAAACRLHAHSRAAVHACSMRPHAQQSSCMRHAGYGVHDPDTCMHSSAFFDS